MSQSSEVKPGFVSNWADNPAKRNFPPPADFSAFTLWGVLDNDRDGNPVPAAKVQIASAEVWLRSKSTGAWARRQQQSPTGVIGGAYYRDDWSNQSLSASPTPATSGGGSLISDIPDGHNFHFWPNGNRGTFTPTDVSAVVIVIRARLSPGYTGSPSYTLCAAIDWWRDAGAQWKADFSNNKDGGIGRFKRVQKDMRAYTMAQGDLSTLPPVQIDAAELR